MSKNKNNLNADGSYANVFLNVNTSADRTAYTSAISPRILSFQELENIYNSDGFAKRVVDLPAREIVKNGFEIEHVEKEDDVMSQLEGLKLDTKLCEALQWSRLYGGALIVMVINDGGELTDPLNVNNIKELEQLRVYDKTEVTRNEKYNDPSDKRYGQTKLWNINPSTGMPYIIHESRCAIIDGMPVPNRTREENDGWGGSVIQQCYDQLQRFGMSHYWANGLLERAQQGIHGIPGLTDILRSPGGESLIRQRVDLVDMARSINNTVVIDAAESYDLKSTSLAGVSDLIDRLGIALCATSGIPESLLFGKQQGGMNANNRNDMENWYSSIKQMQQTLLLPALDRIVGVQLRAMGLYNDNYKIEFNPLYLESEKEQTENAYKEAQTREIYYNMGALDASEVRAKLEDYVIDDVEISHDSVDLAINELERVKYVVTNNMPINYKQGNVEQAKLEGEVKESVFEAISILENYLHGKENDI